MGLFGGKENCAICGKPASGMKKMKVADGVICGDCRMKCSPAAESLPLKSIEEIKAHIQRRMDSTAAGFSATDAVGDYLQVDRKTKTWCCPVIDKRRPDVFPFSALLEYELVEDGVSITKGGLGSAVAGGVLFGGVGAIVGGGLGKKQKDMCSRMSVVISLRDDFIPRIELPLITAETKKGGFMYKNSKVLGERIVSLLAVIASEYSRAQPMPADMSPMDELLKLKKLLDAGAITQAEYDTKKRQLLAL